MGSSSRSRNQLAAAGPIVPLIDQRRPALAAEVCTWRSATSVRLGETYWSFQ